MIRHWALSLALVFLWCCSTRVPEQYPGTVPDKHHDAGANARAKPVADGGGQPLAQPAPTLGKPNEPADSGAPKQQPMPAAVAAGAACTKAPPFVGQRHSKTTIAGKAREYDVWVPASFDNQRPLALVFVFHQAGGTIADAVGFGLQNSMGALENAIYVFPQALAYAQYGVGWDPSCSGPDVQLVQHIRAELAADFCTSLDRVFATGFSWGGDFANVLGCCPGTTFRAVASASGAEWGPEVKVNADCGSARASAYRLTYGSEDNSYPSAQFDAVIALFRKALTCRDNPQASEPTPCVQYQGCQAPMIVCKYANMGHSLPPNWAADTWSFFSSFRAGAKP